MKVTVTHDRAAISRKLETAAGKAVAVLAEQALKDSNYYCRQDQGTLISSSQTASNPEKGVIAWDTPYAKRVYYTGTPSKDKNKNAELMWVEKARAAHKADWQAIAQKALREGMS